MAENELARAVPSYIEMNSAPSINTNIDPRDAMFETVRILHALDPLVSGNPEKYSAGMLVLGNGEVIYDPKIKTSKPKFSLVYYYKEYVQFRHREDPKVKDEGIVVASSRDPRSTLAEEARQWVKIPDHNGKPMRKVREVHNFIGLLKEIPNQYFMWRNDRTSYRSGNELLKYTVSASNYPMWAMLYEMGTAIVDANDFKVQAWKYQPVRNEKGQPEFVDSDMYQRGKVSNQFLAEHFSNLNVKVAHKDVSMVDPEVAETSDDPKEF